MVNVAESNPKIVGVIELAKLANSPIYWVWELPVKQTDRFVILRCDIPLDGRDLIAMTDKGVLDYLGQVSGAFYYPGNPL